MRIKHQAIAAIACGLLCTPAVYAQGDEGAYWSNPDGEAYKNADGECWKKPDWTEADATMECDPDLVPKPKPKPVAKPAPAPQPTAVIEEVSMSADANFAFDSAVLKPEGAEAIRQMADRVMDVKDLSIDIAGHTDSVGSEAYNQGLSEERAASAKAALVDEGIDPAIITTRGYGETAPLTTNATSEGRATNRRVDVSVTGAKKVMR